MTHKDLQPHNKDLLRTRLIQYRSEKRGKKRNVRKSTNISQFMLTSYTNKQQQQNQLSGINIILLIAYGSAGNYAYTAVVDLDLQINGGLIIQILD